MPEPRREGIFTEGASPAPQLLLGLPAWHRVFFQNLADLVLRRRPCLPEMTSAPAPFWADVFTPSGLPLRGFGQSLLYHVFIVTAIWGLTYTWLNRPQPQGRRFFQNTTISYYRADDLLPPLSGPTEAPRRERRGAPTPARQRILSLLPAPDNRHQTIISPPAIRLARDVPLPNMVIWTPVAPRPPLVVARHSPAPLTLPSFVVPPAPDPGRNLAPSRQPALEAKVVPPSPAASDLHVQPAQVLVPKVVAPAPPLQEAHLRLPEVPVPSVVAPAPSLNRVTHGSAMMNAGRLDPRIAAPPAPPAAIPVSTALQASSSGGAAGQYIALSLNPATIAGPVGLPAGNRAGEFMAAPEGTPGAPGTPDIRAGTGNGSGEGGTTAGPAGISISAGPAAPALGAVVARTTGQASPPAVLRQTLLAALRTPHVGDIGRAARKLVDEPTKIAGEVFGPKRIYTMVVNSPNLTSIRGTWIVRFAELHQDSSPNPVTAPVVAFQVDPSYPIDLLRAGVEGRVTLYAVIGSDGSVSQVRVLKGVNQRLDQNACIALAHWRFRPAIKNGTPIDLEAVVQVPFLSGRAGN